MAPRIRTDRPRSCPAPGSVRTRSGRRNWGTSHQRAGGGRTCDPAGCRSSSTCACARGSAGPRAPRPRPQCRRSEAGRPVRCRSGGRAPAVRRARGPGLAPRVPGRSCGRSSPRARRCWWHRSWRTRDRPTRPTVCCRSPVLTVVEGVESYRLGAGVFVPSSSKGLKGTACVWGSVPAGSVPTGSSASPWGRSPAPAVAQPR